jgi:ABC-2 type transport system permease protein
MNKFWTILKAEYSQVVKKKSFIVGIILTPVFLIGITVLPALLADKKISSQERYAIIDTDGRGLGERFAESLNRYKLDDDTTTSAYELTQVYNLTRGASDRLDSMRVALDSALLQKQLKYYVVIFPNVEKNDSALMVSKSLSFKTSARFERRISDILSSLRLENSNINLPVDSILAMTRSIDMLQASPGGKKRDFLTVYFGALIFVMIVFGSVISFGQVLMRSVIEEKNSRVMEVLISSVSPFQLMMGKVIGLGAANLTQIGIWVTIGLALFIFRGAVEIPAEAAAVVFNPILIGYFIVFLILAYIIYATLFAFIGSICNTDKEAQNFIFPIVMSLMLPIFMLMYIVQEPDGTLAVVLSLIPIFTPTMMVARLNIIGPENFSFTDPIIMEATIGVLLSTLFALLMIWVTGRVFRIGILMYGKRPTMPEIIKWVRHR